MAQEGGVRRAPKIGYSRPSPQIRYGPAPLASFEDLPSEDLVSLADENELKFDLNDEDDALNVALGINEGTSVLQPDNVVSPCPTLTPVFDGADEERRFSGVSQNTLVAAEDLQRAHRLSATSTTSSTAAAGGEPKRKGSWTDILFRGRSRSKSPIENECESGAGKKGKEDTASTQKKKKKGVLSIFTSHSDSNKGKKCKSPANSKKNTPSPSRLVTNDLVISANTLPIAKEIPKLSVTTATIENTSVSCNSLDVDSLSHDSEGNFSQSRCQPICREEQREAFYRSPSLERVSFSDECISSLNDERQVCEQPAEQQLPSDVNAKASLIRRKLTKRSDSEISECQSLPETLPSTRTALQIPNEATVDEDRLSDASEETITGAEDSSAITLPRLEIEYDDCEQANLIASESIDLEECSLSQPVVDESNVLPVNSAVTSSVQISSKQQRAQELAALISVNRPRSTTPVSIAPLEEYLRKASLSPDSDANAAALKDKIKLVLPGDQFASCSRGKLARKSNPQIWLDFCEKSFSTSPNIRKKIMHWSSSEVNSPYKDNDQVYNENCALKVNESKIASCNTLSPNDAFTPVTDTPLTPVTPLDDNDPFQFGDSFDPSSFLRAKGLIIPAECNRCMCKLKRETCDLIADASPTSSNEETDSPLLEVFTDPRIQENQVLLPPKATTSNIDFPVSSECVLDEDNLQEDEPLISCNSCQCSCHSASRRNTIASHIHTKGKGEVTADTELPAISSHRPRKQDSILSGSSDISSPSSHLANSSSSGQSSLNGCPIHLDSENPKTV